MFKVSIATLLATTQATPNFCSELVSHLPSDCTCTSQKLGATVSCSINFFNEDTIDITGELELCQNPARADIYISDTKFGIKHELAGLTAGKAIDIPIPGLSLDIPDIGSVGVNAVFDIEGDLSNLEIKLGLDACGKVLGHSVCGSKLTKKLPLYVLDHTFNFDSLCKEAKEARNSMHVSSSSVSVSELTFSQYVLNHNKIYSSISERHKRQEIFTANKQVISKLSTLNPHATFTLDVPSADLTVAEFRQQNTGYVPHSGNKVIPSTLKQTMNTFQDLKIQKIDWRDHGAVDPYIFEQGECGCCWAISVAQTVGSQYFLHSKDNNASNKTVQSLSFQQLICCDCGSVDAGCHGGDPHTAYKYIINAGGLESNTDYPFTDSGPDAQSCNLNDKCGQCKFEKKEIDASITSYRNVTESDHASGNPGNETKLAEVLASEGPISVCIDSDPWRFYAQGILSYGARNLNHCVQLIGFDSTNSVPYWILKNSWGEKWGEKGYIRMEMGMDVCGVADVATMPVV